MSETATPGASGTGGEATPTTTADPASGAEQTPPWGTPEEFNAEKAWNLIQNLRGDNTDLKAKNAEAEQLRTQLKEYEDAKLSEQEKAARDLTEAQTENASLSLDNARLRAVLEHDALTIDDLDLIGGTNAEEVKEAAAKLAARLGTGAPTPPPTNRPNEALRGGGDPTVPAEPQDWLRAALSKTN